MSAPEYQIPEERPALPCPCCRCLTLAQRGSYEICPVCFWEEDGQDEVDSLTVRGGPSATLGLAQARANFAAFGACDEQSIRNVRKPFRFELP